MHSATADIDSNYFNYCQVESDNHSIIIEIEQFPEVPPIKKKTKTLDDAQTTIIGPENKRNKSN